MTPAVPAHQSATMSDEDERLLEGLRSGDSEACEEVARRITPLIRSGIYSAQEFDDVRQQCILQLLEVVRSPAPIRSIWGLVQRIAMTTVIDHNRATVRRRRRDGAATPDERDPLAAVADGRPAPDAIVGERDLVLYVYQRLEAKCRQIVQLVFLEELSYADAAAELGVSEGALRVRIHRCRKEAVRIRDEALSLTDRS